MVPLFHTEVDFSESSATRPVSYTHLAGTDAGTRLADEKYWGGNAGSAGSDDAKNRVSYLVKNYTTGTTAARLAGKSSDTKAATNIPVNLTFSVESIDMTKYGNGFRGIGSSSVPYTHLIRVFQDRDGSTEA